MLEIIREEEPKPCHYSVVIGPLYEIEPYHTYISSDTNNVEVSLHIKDRNSESVVFIPGGLGLVEVARSDLWIFTEEPVTVHANGSDSQKEEAIHQKK